MVELKSKFVANDLDVVESRALHACLPDRFENDADGAKTAWRVGFRKRLQELLAKEALGQLKPAETRRPVYKVNTVVRRLLSFCEEYKFVADAGHYYVQ